jgi:hypothetical protein
MRSKVLTILIVVAISMVVWGELPQAVTPNTFVSGTPAYASNVNENFDSLRIPINNALDSIEAGFIRFSDLDGGDSTLARMQADTLSVGDSAYIAELRATNGKIDTLDADSIAVAAGISAATINTGNGDYELYAMNQNVATTSAVTFSTVNTGQGANELYDMNQNVLTTSDVTFNTVNGMTDTEMSQIENLGTTAISSTQWGYLGAANQGITTTSDVTFGNVTGDTLVLGPNKAYGWGGGGAALKLDAAAVDLPRSRFSGDLSPYTQRGSNCGQYGSGWKAVVADSLNIMNSAGTGAAFAITRDWYRDTSFVCTLYVSTNGGWKYFSSDTVGAVRAIKVGTQTTFEIGDMNVWGGDTAGVTNTTFSMKPTLPYTWRPAYDNKSILSISFGQYISECTISASAGSFTVGVPDGGGLLLKTHSTTYIGN